jgi:hypothetical protein
MIKHVTLFIFHVILFLLLNNCNPIFTNILEMVQLLLKVCYLSSLSKVSLAGVVILDICKGLTYSPLDLVGSLFSSHYKPFVLIALEYFELEVKNAKKHAL